MAWDMNGPAVESEKVAFTSLSDGQKLDKVIAGLKERGSESAAGIERIEHMHPNDALSAPVAGTIFSVVADILREAGVVGDMDTVGQVMTAMGADRNLFGPNRFRSDVGAQCYLAHEVGCHCHGASSNISVADAAKRLETLRGKVRS